MKLSPGSCLLLASLLALPSIALAADTPAETWRRHPGFVDSAPLSALVTDEDDRVEVSVAGPLLHALSGLLRGQDEEAARAIAELESVHTLIIGLPGERFEKGLTRLRQMDRELREKGWSQLARVQEEGSLITVLVLARGESIEGLTVLGVDRGESQLIFTNFAGTIDLEQIGRLSEKMDIPALPPLEGLDER